MKSRGSICTATANCVEGANLSGSKKPFLGRKEVNRGITMHLHDNCAAEVYSFFLELPGLYAL